MTSPADVARLAQTMTIDLTTIGRRSGRASRIEIWWFHIEDRFIITGTPGKRDWYANVLADPTVTIHTGFGDYPGTAMVVTDVSFRRRVFTHPGIGWYRSQAELDELVASAPMIEIQLY